MGGERRSIRESEHRMADVFSLAKRASVMSRIRSKGNRDTEMALLALLRAHKIHGWRRNSSLPGRPDFIFAALRIAVFVDGCFWHGCPKHFRMPESNADYWVPKLTRNKVRDREVARQLKRRGWQVVRLWEHDLRNEGKVLRKIFGPQGFHDATTRPVRLGASPNPES
jgi:DNA mismatch endonuclease (patch repair protein)